MELVKIEPGLKVNLSTSENTFINLVGGVVVVVFEFVFDNDDDDDDEVEVGIEVDEEGSSCCACAMMVLVDDVEVEETNWARSLPLLMVAILVLE